MNILTVSECESLISKMMKCIFNYQFFKFNNGFKYFHYIYSTEQELIEIIRRGLPRNAVRVTLTSTNARFFLKKFKTVQQSRKAMDDCFDTREANQNSSNLSPNPSILSNSIYEEQAIKLWELDNPGFEVKKSFQINNPKLPFLTCSVDGMITIDGKVVDFIEVKTFDYLKIHNFDDFFYFGKANRKGLSRKYYRGKYIYYLKKSHMTFLQVQLAMCICNMNRCFLLIFSPFENDYIQLIIERKKNFLSSKINYLRKNYIKYIVPYLIEKNVSFFDV